MSAPVQDKDINFFPHLPSYSDPKTGVLAHLPSSWIPYAQLMRLDRPAGLYAFYLPYLIGIMYAACISSEPPEPQTVFGLALLLLPFNVLLRGAVCTWNDNVDQRFDRRVERCRHRPIARGAVSTVQANMFILLQLGLGVPLTLLFSSACFSHVLISVLLLSVYSLMKRITYYPQVVLGISFAWAIPFSVAAMGVEPSQQYSVPTLALFLANTLWTIIYDTIYDHQDIADDEKAGVKGMALRFKNNTKALATILSIGQIALLVLCGIYAGFTSIYYVGTVGGVSAALAYYIYDVDLKQPESCGLWFRDQFRSVGCGFLAGLIGEYVSRVMI